MRPMEAPRRHVAAAAALAAAPLRRVAVAAAAAAARRGDDASAGNAPVAPSIAGTWSVTARHDVDSVMELWGLNAIARATAKRIGGLEIAVAAPPDDAAASASDATASDPAPPPAHHLAVRYLCPVPQFSVREVVPLAGGGGGGGGGGGATLRRRDLKPGKCSARARVLSPCGGRVAVETAWEGCAMEEVYELVPGGSSGEEGDTLVLRTTLRCRRPGEEGGREARAVQVYKRRA